MFTQRDDFLSPTTFGELVEHAKRAAFSDIRSDVDFVTYPLICLDVPEMVRKEIEFLAGQRASQLFLRASPEGVPVPNEVHTDNSMGRTSLMLYLQDGPDVGEAQVAGTSFLRHEVLGVAYAPRVEELVRLCREDANNRHAWRIHSFCRMRANRACIFDAGYFHRAEPVGGFGSGASARCVLTGFFD